MASKLHVRSNSLPNGSHPCSSRVRDQLNNLKAFEATSTSESVVTSLSFLEDLHSSLDDLLNVASTQKVIFQQEGDKCIEEILDGSMKVLDTCGITRDTVMQIKENVQFLHSALRRRKGDSTIETSIAEYNSFSKKMKKNVNKVITSLKQLQSKFGASQLLNEEVMSVLREVIAMNVSIFQSLLTFFARPASKSKAAKWMNKLMHKGVVASENSENCNELQLVDATLNILLKEGANGSNMKVAHEQLEALEIAIESIEIRLESLFRSMIKTKTSLLNILSQ
ncbi:uncharacterized protein LOC107487424 [Arachis duranensis]|uniref:Uncharacterized protein LOC107487424 n=1 Tax=Arachis duranensis TaxID=130453 RepID=A0A6P4DB37_ARADU|nr:uncharacterized protein LOC107487424 [Arachis duranensis]XP_025650765.1 uncharacterized protein LOC112746845 [Arachis hypogaea]XP_025703295.1 uncharacterized protein LOC112804080 [Arachis hypogaea]QHO40319.1 DUF241 domain protein [Arachis hypogaea]